MSHTVQVDLEIKDLGSLEAAAARCGLQMNRGQQSYRWFGSYMADYPLPKGIRVEQLGRCDHALSIANRSGAYEVGVVDQGDGTYRLLFDFWNGGEGLLNAIGEGASKLRNEYTIAVTEATALAQGWLTQRDGNELVIFPAGGGELRVAVDPITQDMIIDAKGYSGQSCAAATDVIAAALGSVKSQTLKPEWAQVVNTAIETE